MCDPGTVALTFSVLSAGATVYGAQKQYEAAGKAGVFNSQIAKINEKLALQSADDAIIRGAQKESASRVNTAQLIGSQRAAIAASGIVVGEGTTADIIDQAVALGELDALIIRDNALRESEAFRLEAESARLGGGLSISRAEGRQEAIAFNAASQLFQIGAGLADR